MIVLRYKMHDKPLPITYEVARIESTHITVELCWQEDGSFKWAVRDGFRMCLHKEGGWDFESLPSNRPEDWISTHRWDSFEEAAAAAMVAAQETLRIQQDRVAFLNAREDAKAAPIQ